MGMAVYGGIMQCRQLPVWHSRLTCSSLAADMIPAWGRGGSQVVCPSQEKVYTSLGNFQALRKAMTDYHHMENEKSHREQRFLIPVRPGESWHCSMYDYFHIGIPSQYNAIQQLLKPPNLWKDANYHRWAVRLVTGRAVGADGVRDECGVMGAGRIESLWTISVGSKVAVDSHLRPQALAASSQELPLVIFHSFTQLLSLIPHVFSHLAYCVINEYSSSVFWVSDCP